MGLPADDVLALENVQRHLFQALLCNNHPFRLQNIEDVKVSSSVPSDIFYVSLRSFKVCVEIGGCDEADLRVFGQVLKQGLLKQFSLPFDQVLAINYSNLALCHCCAQQRF